MLLEIVAAHTGGDPMSERKWLNCRLMDIQERLEGQGHGVSQPVISRLLKQNDYSLKANAKQFEGKQHPDRGISNLNTFRNREPSIKPKGSPSLV